MIKCLKFRFSEKFPGGPKNFRVDQNRSFNPIIYNKNKLKMRPFSVISIVRMNSKFNKIKSLLPQVATKIFSLIKFVFSILECLSGTLRSRHHGQICKVLYFLNTINNLFNSHSLMATQQSHPFSWIAIHRNSLNFRKCC